MDQVITRNQEGTKNCLYPPGPRPLPVTPTLLQYQLALELTNPS